MQRTLLYTFGYAYFREWDMVQDFWSLTPPCGLPLECGFQSAPGNVRSCRSGCISQWQNAETSPRRYRHYQYRQEQRCQIGITDHRACRIGNFCCKYSCRQHTQHHGKCQQCAQETFSACSPHKKSTFPSSLFGH